jgi:ABC-type branched-subunit amino acid transport system substrate-binding protein
MIRPNFAWRSVAVLGVAALALGACADNGDGDGDLGPGDEPFEGTLNVGVILPQSGQLAFLAPPMFAGLDLALEEINADGGVWGSDVELSIVDEGDPETPDVAVTNAGTLVREGVNAVVGAAASGITVNIIEAFRDAQIIQVSPSNTGIALDEHPARDYYFRTAPSDVMQGTVLGDEIIADGHGSIVIMARQDAYGEGLANQTAEVYEAGGGEVLDIIVYDPGAADFSSEVARVRELDPDAIVLVTFEEALRIMTTLIEQNLGVADGKQWYLVDGNHEEWGDQLPAGALDGVKSTAPTPADEPEAFYDRMREAADEELTTLIYGPETYDALMLIALGAIAANSDNPDDIRAAMVEISRSPGTDCSGFADCAALLRDGEDINYTGASGPVNWNDRGDPIQSTIGVYLYTAENTYTLDRVEPTQLEE